MKILYTLVALVLMSIVGHAQSFSLFDEANNEVTNQTVTIVLHPSSPIVTHNFQVFNSTQNAINTNVRRFEQSCTEGSGEFFCWTLCLLAEECGSNFMRDMPFGTAIEANSFYPAGLIVDFDPSFESDEDGVEGESIYTYVVYDQNNSTDSAYVNVKYVVDYDVSVKEVDELSFSHVYPNPASDQIQFSISGNQTTAQFQIYSLLGEQIKTQQVLTANGLVSIDVLDLKPGVYLLTEVNSNLTRRFIISR